MSTMRSIMPTISHVVTVRDSYIFFSFFISKLYQFFSIRQVLVYRCFYLSFEHAKKVISLVHLSSSTRHPIFVDFSNVMVFSYDGGYFYDTVFSISYWFTHACVWYQTWDLPGSTWLIYLSEWFFYPFFPWEFPHIPTRWAHTLKSCWWMYSDISKYFSSWWF